MIKMERCMLVALDRKRKKMNRKQKRGWFQPMSVTETLTTTSVVKVVDLLAGQRPSRTPMRSEQS